MARKKTETNPAQGQMPAMSKEEEIGYHKGSLSTLINERNELVKMVQIVDSLLQAHAKRLEELGVKLQTQQGQTSAKK